MNRIILIGNGFDLAHGLRTSYKNFIDDFWEKQIEEIKKEIIDNNGFFNTHTRNQNLPIVSNEYFKIECSSYFFSDINVLDRIHSYADLKEWMDKQRSARMWFTFSNDFLYQISKNLQLNNWVDIEEEYFKLLTKCYADNEKKGEETSYTIKKLNKDFKYVRQAFIGYLLTAKEARTVKEKETDIKIYDYIDFDKDFIHKYLYEIAEANCKSQPSYQMLDLHNEGKFADKKKKELINNEIENLRHNKKECPEELLFLSLNYTETETLYTNEPKEGKTHVQKIHIHGELANPDNPIIFGFGDENCKDYKEIEDLNNNDYLEYFKTTMYSNTSNYRDFLNFIDADKYQVFIMGASCGASDKTLLKTLFEHENCISIKCFYHKIDNNTDDYSDIIKNISRCFSDKAMMRAKVVNKKFCEPLVP
ncbi:MAG: bacteriophage abortive infection AbiH family protein [Prevotellaceae bacterium]|jgi:hypothetical protein|nr:bacteriophage abortive infection AbiH family protein [Prevotellaceae bacterium]